jgi:hypothetical protein
MNDDMRNFFAGLVLPTLIEKSTLEQLVDESHQKFICATAYEFADVMLGIKNEQPKQ